MWKLFDNFPYYMYHFSMTTTNFSKKSLSKMSSDFIYSTVATLSYFCIIPVGHNSFSFFLPRISEPGQMYWKAHIICQMMTLRGYLERHFGEELLLRIPFH